MQNCDLQHRLVDAALPIDEANGKSGQKVGKQGCLRACSTAIRTIMHTFGSYPVETAESWRKILWHAGCAQRLGPICSYFKSMFVPST